MSSKLRAAISVMLIFTILLDLNILFIIDLLSFKINEYVVYSLFGVILILNIKFFIYKENYINIEKAYKDDPVNYKWISILIIIFFLFTAIFLSFYNHNSR